MSRTYKDRPSKVQWPEVYPWNWDCERIECEVPRVLYNVETGAYEETKDTYTHIIYLQKPGVKLKKKRNYVEWNWMTTPMWWIREFMTRPQRAKGRQWEHKVKQLSSEELEDVDKPSVGRKPHVYYW